MWGMGRCPHASQQVLRGSKEKDQVVPSGVKSRPSRFSSAVKQRKCFGICAVQVVVSEERARNATGEDLDQDSSRGAGYFWLSVRVISGLCSGWFRSSDGSRSVLKLQVGRGFG